MKKVNVSEMRNVEGGARYKCLVCGKKGGQTKIYWHVFLNHKRKHISAWDLIEKI